MTQLLFELAPPLDLLRRLLGDPLDVAVLKYKPARRLTARALGPRGSAIVKVYASDRAAVVGARVAALAAGPEKLVTPEVIAVDEPAHSVVLTDVGGDPLRAALLEGRLGDCERAGRALAAWHGWWTGRVPATLQPHSAAHELHALRRQASGASRGVGAHALGAAERLSQPWSCHTVVHRDLYEEQIMLGDRVGLIDLDDAAAGPPELDIGNLLAHIELLSLRHGVELVEPRARLLDGYMRYGDLDLPLLHRCRRLSLLRLACINDDPQLLMLAAA